MTRSTLRTHLRCAVEGLAIGSIFAGALILLTVPLLSLIIMLVTP